MRPPGALWARGALAGAILRGIAATAARSLAAGSPSPLATLAAAGLAGLVGLAGLIGLARGWLIEPTSPGAVRRAGGLPAAFPLSGTPVAPWFLPTRAAGIAMPWLLGVLCGLLLGLGWSGRAAAAAPAASAAAAAGAVR